MITSVHYGIARAQSNPLTDGKHRLRVRRTVVLGVHSLCAGGTERVVSTLLEAFDRIEELDVHCILYGRRPVCFYAIPEGVTLHKPPFEFEAFPRAIAILKTTRHIRSVVRKVEPDAFLNFGERWNNLALLSVRGLGVRTLVADRSSPTKGLGVVHERLRNFLYARATGVIVQTREASARISQMLPPNTVVHVIPNPLFSRPEFVGEGGSREVLFVGRLIPTKHVDRLIRIFARTRVPGWHLTIVGGDAQGYSEFGKLQTLARSLGLERWVHLEGTQADVYQYYRRAAIFAFPSSSEGFPNVLAEALSFGLPSVAYNCSAGPADLISNGENGYLVPTHDDERFLQCLRHLMTDADVREAMSAKALESVAHLDPDRIAAKFLAASEITLGDDLRGVHMELQASTESRK